MEMNTPYYKAKYFQKMKEIEKIQQQVREKMVGEYENQLKELLPLEKKERDKVKTIERIPLEQRRSRHRLHEKEQSAWLYLLQCYHFFPCQESIARKQILTETAEAWIKLSQLNMLRWNLLWWESEENKGRGILQREAYQMMTQWFERHENCLELYKTMKTKHGELQSILYFSRQKVCWEEHMIRLQLKFFSRKMVCLLSYQEKLRLSILSTEAKERNFFLEHTVKTLERILLQYVKQREARKKFQQKFRKHQNTLEKNLMHEKESMNEQERKARLTLGRAHRQKSELMHQWVTRIYREREAYVQQVFTAKQNEQASAYAHHKGLLQSLAQRSEELSFNLEQRRTQLRGLRNKEEGGRQKIRYEEEVEWSTVSFGEKLKLEDLLEKARQTRTRLASLVAKELQERQTHEFIFQEGWYRMQNCIQREKIQIQQIFRAYGVERRRLEEEEIFSREMTAYQEESTHKNLLQQRLDAWEKLYKRHEAHTLEQKRITMHEEEGRETWSREENMARERWKKFELQTLRGVEVWQRFEPLLQDELRERSELEQQRWAWLQQYIVDFSRARFTAYKLQLDVLGGAERKDRDTLHSECEEMNKELWTHFMASLSQVARSCSPEVSPRSALRNKKTASSCVEGHSLSSRLGSYSPFNTASAPHLETIQSPSPRVLPEPTSALTFLTATLNIPEETLHGMQNWVLKLAFITLRQFLDENQKLNDEVLNCEDQVEQAQFACQEAQVNFEHAVKEFNVVKAGTEHKLLEQKKLLQQARERRKKDQELLLISKNRARTSEVEIYKLRDLMENVRLETREHLRG